MARMGSEKGRLKIQWIMDNTKRKAALRRRLPNLLKKARELAVLCDVPVCLVVYRPGEAEPVVWPSPGEAADIVRQYRDEPDLQRFKNELDGIDFLKKMNEKARVELSIAEQECRDKEVELAVADFIAGRRKSFDDLPTDYLVSIGLMLDNKIHAINARLQKLRSGVAPAPFGHGGATGTSSAGGNSSSAAGSRGDGGGTSTTAERWSYSHNLGR